MNDSLIIFLHIPKAAGASLRKCFQMVYGEPQVFWIRPGSRPQSLKSLDAMTPSERDRIRVVTGHIPLGLVEGFFARPIEYVTVLRDPIDSIRSFYQFALSQPDHPDHALAARGGLAEFAASDVRGLENQQTRIVSGLGGRGQVTPETYTLARRNLHSFGHVGTQEGYAEFIDRLAIHLGWPETPDPGTIHKTESPIQVDPHAEEIILARNEWDRKLHREAIALGSSSA